MTVTDQVITLSRSSTVLTATNACPTAVAAVNGTIFANGTTTCSPTSLQTLTVDVTAPFNELGPLAIPGYAGSGLCTDCVISESETRQRVLVTRCLDAACTSFTEEWVYVIPEPTTIISEVPFTSEVVATETGVNVITVTATFTPGGSPAGNGGNGAPLVTAPVTTVFAITTSVPRPQTIVIDATITVTFVAAPQPIAESSEAPVVVSTTTRVPSNGIYTIPVVTTVAPQGPFTSAVPTTVYIITTVNNGPQVVTATQTIIVTFINIIINNPTFITIINGATQLPGPQSTDATTTQSSIASTSDVPTVATLTSTTTSGTSVSTLTTTTTPAPTPVADSEVFSYVGCLGSSDGFSTFNLDSESAVMDVDLCTSECQAAGATYAGLYST